MKYLVGITETLCRYVIVEADSAREAESIVSNKYTDCAIVLDSDDFSDVEIQCIKRADTLDMSCFDEV